MNRPKAHFHNCFYCDTLAQLESLLTTSPMSDYNNSVTLHTTASEKSKTKKSIAFLKECIDSIDQAMAALQKKRSEMTNSLRRFEHTMLSPIRCIPPEILELIFRHCVDDWVSQRDGFNSDGSWYISPRRIITQVCQYWRNVALQDPDLWCDIKITEYFGSYPAGNPRLEHELALSKDRPLHIFSISHEDDDIIEDYPEILEQLARTRHRWSTFSTSSSLGDFFALKEPYAPRGGAKFPHLKSLSGPFRSDEYIPVTNDTHAVDTPSLMHLDIDLLHHHGEPPIIPWWQLQGLRLHSAQPSCLAAILTRLSAVSRLYLRITPREDDISPYPKQPILLPCAEILELDMRAGREREQPFIKQANSNIGTDIIGLLRLPALKTLSCHGLTHAGFESVVEMLQETSFPSPPQGGIQTLKLIDLDCLHPTSFDPLFQKLPNLKTLHMEHFNHPSSCRPLESLGREPNLGRTMLCPDLECLSLSDGCIWPNFLQRFIVFRLQIKSSIDKVGLTRLVLDRTCRLESNCSSSVKALADVIEAFAGRPGNRVYADIQIGGDESQRLQRFPGSKNATLTLV